MDQIADEDVTIYHEAQGFIGDVNSIAGQQIVYPNPQMVDTPIGAAAWLLNREVDAAFLPYPVYAAIEAADLSPILTPLASVPAVGAMIVGNRAACESALPFPQLIAHSRFLGGNDYATTGRLLAELLFVRYGQKPLGTLYNETSPLAVAAFANRSEATEPTMYLTDSPEGKKVIGTVKGTCALLDDIVVPWPAAVLVVHDEAPPQFLALLRGSILTMADNGLQYAREFTPPGAELELQLDQARSLIRQHQIDPRGFFDIGEFTLRLRNWVKSGPTAFILPPSNSRAAYSLGSAARTFLELEKHRDLANDVFLVGNSGGAIGSLVLALAPEIGSYEWKTIETVLNPDDIMRPATRYKLILAALDWWPIVILVIWLLLRTLFFGEMFFWTVMPPGPNRSHILLAASVLSTLVAFLLPPLPIEKALPFLGALFLVLIVLLLLPQRRRLGLWSYAVTAVTVIVLMATVNGTFFRPALMDRLDIETPIRKLSAVSDALRPCAVHGSGEDFSRCLFGHLRYPLVITASDLLRSRQIVFYANPNDSIDRLSIPRKGDWVNLADCPEHLIKVTEASASYPFILPPISMTCAGKTYLLIDGAVFAAGTSALAAELGATTAVTFLDAPFSPQAMLGLVSQDLRIENPLQFFRTLAGAILGRNVNFEFQGTLPKLRHVIFTPSALLPPTYHFFGVTKNVIAYAQPAIFQLGFLDASNPDGHFLQVSGGPFRLDLFTDLLKSRPSAD